MSEPCVLIVWPLEGSPRIVLAAMNDGEEARLLDWIHRNERVDDALERIAALGGEWRQAA